MEHGNEPTNCIKVGNYITACVVRSYRKPEKEKEKCVWRRHKN
jgi:hypothetical protein